MPLITNDQILCHIIGDYFIQSDWMATNKKDEVFPCFIHSISYSLPFLFLTHSVLSLFVICATHFVIDHYGLPRYLIWARNWLFGGTKSWKECELTGYSPDRPVWLAFCLMVAVDNS